MPRTTIAPQAPPAGGLTPAYAAVDNVNGMQFVNSGRSLIHIKASGALTVTFRMPGTADGVAAVNGGKQVVFGGAGEQMISLRNLGLYQQADGYTYADFTTSAGTIAVFEGGAA